MFLCKWVKGFTISWPYGAIIWNKASDWGSFQQVNKKPCRTWLWVTTVEFKSHTHPALWVVVWNNLDKPRSNRIKPVYYWRKVVAVTIKHLEKKKKNKTTKLELQRLSVRKKKHHRIIAYLGDPREPGTVFKESNVLRNIKHCYVFCPR